MSFSYLFPAVDNTASIITRRSGFRRQEQSVYYLPIFIVDSGSPSLSSTNTLTIRVCDCDTDGIAQTCNAEAYILPAGLSTGALIAILACVLTLLGMSFGFCSLTIIFQNKYKCCCFIYFFFKELQEVGFQKGSRSRPI